MPLEKLTGIKVNGLQGGATTVREKPLLPFGSFSEAQNVRGRHPGFIKRKGQTKLHVTNDGSNEILSLYQFNKVRSSESYFYGQFSDGDVLVATTDPPGITSGAFGTEVHDGTSGQIAASWGNVADKLVYSNGKDQHQLYAGSTSVINKVIVYKGSAAIPTIPVEGVDYSVEATDYNTSTTADFSSLGTLAAYDAVFIQTSVQAKSLTFTMTNLNTTSGVAQVKYWNGAWSAVSGFSDGTSTGGATFGKTGTMSWTIPTDILPKYAFSANGWWYQVSLSTGATDSSTTIQSITFDCDWQNIVNVWDGSPIDAIEAWFYDASVGAYNIHGSSNIDLDAMTTSDKVYFATTDPIDGFYVDPSTAPNENSANIDEVYYWDGSAWVGIVAGDSNSIDDGTNGITQAGWVTFPRPTNTPQPFQFEGTPFYAYWYYFTVDATLSADTNIGIQYSPYFDISELGKSKTNCVWKDRVVYTFDNFSEYLYFSAPNQPLILNGFNYGILEVGDGRAHDVVAMRRFHNELMVWQEEKGVEGGCITLIEGNHPTNFGKLLLSSKIGTMNNKSVVVVEGVLTSTATDERVKTLAFFLSRYGVAVCDGRTVQIISDDIQNYFNPHESECIRRGYESKMWIGHDSRENVLRIGLVSGSSATLPNIFPVYDLTDKVWYFDTPAQELSCMTEVDAQSGNTIINQVGGGIDDGFVYLLNSGDNDVSTAIDARIRIDFGNIGELIKLRELLLRWKAQESGELYIRIYVNGVLKNKYSWEKSMTPRKFGETVSRFRKSLSVKGHTISIMIGNDQKGQTMYLEDLGVSTQVWKGV